MDSMQNGNSTQPTDTGKTGSSQKLLRGYCRKAGISSKIAAQVGLSIIYNSGQPTLRIPYRNNKNKDIGSRYLPLNMDGTPAGSPVWEKDTRPAIFGLNLLDKTKFDNKIYVTPRETDCLTLMSRGIKSVAVPERILCDVIPQWAQVDKFNQILIPCENGNRQVIVSLFEFAPKSIRDKMLVFDLPEKVVGLTNYYQLHQTGFTVHLTICSAKPRPLADIIGEIHKVACEQALAACRETAESPNVLEAFCRDLAASGFDGNFDYAKLLYLAFTSRLLDKPVNIFLSGESSSGKSHLVEKVLEFFPENAYLKASGMSPMALFYSSESFARRFLYFTEMEGTKSGKLTYWIRTLLSEGELSYHTTRNGEGEKITKEGPTGLVTTSTAQSWHEENDTRFLILKLVFNRDALSRSLVSIAGGGTSRANKESPRIEGWKKLQTFLENVSTEVVIPYGEILAQLIPPRANRLRRDFVTTLTLIKAHAVLQQLLRQRNEQGAIIAEIQDYRVVRELVGKIIAEGIEISVPSTIRDTVVAVRKLHHLHPEGVTLQQLVDELSLNKATVSRRVTECCALNYLRKSRSGRGRGEWIQPGDPLPSECEVLPPVEILEQAIKHPESIPELRAKIPGFEIAVASTPTGTSGNPQPKSGRGRPRKN